MPSPESQVISLPVSGDACFIVRGGQLVVQVNFAIADVHFLGGGRVEKLVVEFGPADPTEVPVKVQLGIQAERDA